MKDRLGKAQSNSGYYSLLPNTKGTDVCIHKHSRGIATVQHQRCKFYSTDLQFLTCYSHDLDSSEWPVGQRETQQHIHIELTDSNTILDEHCTVLLPAAATELVLTSQGEQVLLPDKLHAHCAVVGGMYHCLGETQISSTVKTSQTPQAFSAHPQTPASPSRWQWSPWRPRPEQVHKQLVLLRCCIPPKSQSFSRTSNLTEHKLTVTEEFLPLL